MVVEVIINEELLKWIFMVLLLGAVLVLAYFSPWSKKR
jgi:hypothetical protein